MLILINLITIFRRAGRRTFSPSETTMTETAATFNEFPKCKYARDSRVPAERRESGELTDIYIYYTTLRRNGTRLRSKTKASF